MSMLVDFTVDGCPRTQRGVATSFGSMPWRLNGRALTIWYRLMEICTLVLARPQNVRVGLMWDDEASLIMGEAISDEPNFLCPDEIVLVEYWPQHELVLGRGRVLEGSV